MIDIAVFSDVNRGTRILDVSARGRNIEFTTNDNGFAHLSAFVPMTLRESFLFYDRPGLLYIEAVWNGQMVWQGRLEDVAIMPGGVRLGAFGYWRAMFDSPYIALWSSQRYTAWKIITKTMQSGFEESRFAIDNNNRLHIALQKNAVYGNNTDFGGVRTYIPDGSSRQIATVSFDYEWFAPTGWRAALRASDYDFGNIIFPWSLDGNGASQTGTQNITLAATKQQIYFQIANISGGNYTYTGETGDNFLKITNLRWKTATASTITADAVIADMIDWTRAGNPDILNASNALLQSPGHDLFEALYEDRYPVEIIEELSAMGNTSTPPQLMECGVYEDRIVHLRPRGSAGRAWYVDVSAIEMERTLERLRNFSYGVYVDANGITQRTGGGTDSDSIARFGLYRILPVKVDTTSDTHAGNVASAQLEDKSNPIPRSKIVFRELYDAGGARWPNWMARSGDTITIRNMPPTLSAEIDRVRVFRVSETRYSVDTDTIEVTPEDPVPTIDVLLAQKKRE